MQPDELYQGHKNEWDGLSTLVRQARNGVDRLSPEDVRRLGNLYRAATAHLALAQRDFPRHQVTAYLNHLVAQAHTVIYQGEPVAGRRVRRFISAGYPRQYRRSFPFILVAMALFFIPAILGGVATYLQPSTASAVLPGQVQELVTWLEEGRLWTTIPIEERPYTSSFIMQNNIQVSFLAFAGGVPAGLVTMWTLLLNGVILGGISGLAFHYGIGWDLWAFVIGHGVIELSVICIAGGAGLQLGWAVIHPEPFRRSDALRLSAQEAIRLLVGCVALLVVAGTIEGFLSPAENIAPAIKWGVGIGTGILLYSYLLLGGREASVKIVD